MPGACFVQQVSHLPPPVQTWSHVLVDGRLRLLERTPVTACTSFGRSQDCGGRPSRRDACTAVGTAGLAALVQGWAVAQPARADDGASDRRSHDSSTSTADTTITDTVFLDIGKPRRTIPPETA